MVNIVELLDPTPNRLWSLMPQLGVTDVICVFDDAEQKSRWLSSKGSQDARPPALERRVEGEAPWGKARLSALQQSYRDHGLNLVGIEDTPPLDLVRLALPGRDEQIENLMVQIRAMGELGIPVLCYNWSAITSWSRTDVAVPLRGGALSTAFDLSAMEGTVNLNPDGRYTHDQLWSGLEYFVRAIMPVAEAAGVSLALHPDDPPVKAIRGVPRIMNSMDAFRRLLSMSDSPANGIAFCQGNFALFTDDIPAAIREFGGAGRIKFVHFRDVKGTPEAFYETFHDDGPTDMAACIKAYRDVGYAGPMRPDHVQTLFGEENNRPGYETMGRLFALGYMKGLREAVYSAAD